jgi:YVTN family beta-propeller protein
MRSVQPLARATLALVLTLVAGCTSAPREAYRLPTGSQLDPEGVAIPLGSMPVTMTFSRDSTRIVAVLSGYREQGIQIVDCASRRVLQTLVQPAAFLGACFAPDGRTLCVSGGNRDHVYLYAWEKSATLRDSIALGPAPDSTGGHVYPAGLAYSPDGSRLYVAGNLADSLLVVDPATHRVTQRLATGPYPYAVLVGRDGKVYVSAWGGEWVATFVPRAGGLVPGPRIAVGRHPSAMTLDAAGSRLYVACAASDLIAVVDTRTDSLVATIADPAPNSPGEGSTPDGLALSPDGSRLYVAEADNNAIAVFDIAGSRQPSSATRPALLGRIPVQWYPTAALARGSSLWVLNGKGPGTGPNPRKSQPGRKGPQDQRSYTLGQTHGTLGVLQAPSDRELPALSHRVAAANHWDQASALVTLPPFRHVVYVIRENRTYDQVLGDLPGADGDTSLTFFPRSVTPNAHALAERFGIFDRFFVNGEVSGDGHNWTTAAYAADYVEKTIPSNYSDRGRTYDYDGLNRNRVPEDDVNEGSSGYLWDAARRASVSLRNYGEFTHKDSTGRWIANKRWLAAHTDPTYPGWDLTVPDTRRAERWLAAFAGQTTRDSMPALSILWLPGDHTAGARAHYPTPRAYVADNDLALGRLIEALSRSRYWPSTVVFVLEDDAQDGPDHVDSHRSPLLVISAYNRPGVYHRFANTADVLATIDHILDLGAMSKFDHFGRVITECFAAAPDTTGYRALVSTVPPGETNVDSTLAVRLSRHLDFSREDRADVATLNRVLWLAIKGSRPYPRRAAHPAWPIPGFEPAGLVSSAK